MAKKDVPNPRNSITMKVRVREARRRWRRVREHFVAALGPPESLPLLVGNVQRGVIRTWCSPGGAYPRAAPLRRVLAARGIDPQPFSEFVRWVGPGNSVVRAFCLLGQHKWSSTTSSLNRAERRRKQKSEGPLRRRIDGVVEWPCQNCQRAERGRRNLERINKPGRRRGPDKRPRGNPQKTEQHRLNIADRHLSRAALGHPFHLCTLCGLVIYETRWHQVCRRTWRAYCRKRKLDPEATLPVTVPRRGPDSTRGLMRNYEILMRRAVGHESRRELLADQRLASRAAARRRGRPRMLKSKMAVTQAAKAFIRLIPGAWALVFSRDDGRNSRRDQITPLPTSLRPLIASGARDSLIVRLHAHEMDVAKIGKVTGADTEYVVAVIEKSAADRPDSGSVRSEERNSRIQNG